MITMMIAMMIMIKLMARMMFTTNSGLSTQLNITN
jgi:hypothetical protein